MIAREKIDREKIAQKAKEKIVAIMKEITETSGDLQINHTPPEICEMMLDKVDLDKAESVLVLFNVEFLYELRARGYKGLIYYFTQSMKEVEFAKKLIPDVIIKYIDRKESALDYMSTWPEKFDIIVSNPPYGDKRNTKLHIHFLQKCLEIGNNKVLFVHPSNQYIDQKGTFDSINKKSEKFLSFLKIFNGNETFGIQKFFPVSIALFDLQKEEGKIMVEDDINSKSFEIKNLPELSIFGKRKEFNTIKLKMREVSKGNSLQDKIKNRPKKVGIEKRFFVPFSAIRGNIFITGKRMYKNDFFTLIPRETKSFESTQIDKLKGMAFEFDSIVEANNFISFCKTDFARMCLALLKTDNNLNSQLWLIPWMDFTQEWTDEKLYAHFGITEEEQAFIKEVIPPYYD
jgi:hypothetical protein